MQMSDFLHLTIPTVFGNMLCYYNMVSRKCQSLLQDLLEIGLKCFLLCNLSYVQPDAGAHRRGQCRTLDKLPL